MLYTQSTSSKCCFDILLACGKTSPFADIANVKRDAAEYLQNSTIQPCLCKNQSTLLRNESLLWHELAQYYIIFLKKGIYLSDLQAVRIIKNMEQLMNDIIAIEETIITQSS